MLDRKALEASGVDVNAPVTLQLGGVTLRSALRIMLDDLHLTYAIHNEVLYITTPSAARGMADVRVYDVSQLLAPGDSADDLARTLTESLAAPSETVVPVSSRPVATPDEVLAELHAGGQQPSRSITAYQQMLIVRDTTLGHRELTAALLAIQAGAIRNAEAIRRAQEEAMKAANPTPMPPMPPMPMPPEGEEPAARPEPEVRDS
jgi:hypothetical protein